MSLRPLGKAILFSFCNETYGGQFVEKNKGKILLTNQDLSHQGNEARWAKIVAIGDTVEGLQVNDIVLIEALQWTTKMVFEGANYWKSDETKVIAIGDDESVTYAY